MRILAVVFASAGLALVLASAFTFLACSGGLLFSGISTFFIVLVSVVACAVVTSVTALVFKRRKGHFGWRILSLEVLVLVIASVGILSWLDTRQHLQIFMAPSPVPSGVRVHHGRSILFSSYVHFTGPPSAIASLIQSKGLVEMPDDPEKAMALPGYGLQQRAKAPWDWWQPTAMSNPRFFYRHHESLAVQGWSEGWWVNGATNEVYALISG